jgi:hypothetical protein
MTPAKRLDEALEIGERAIREYAAVTASTADRRAVASRAPGRQAVGRF